MKSALGIILVAALVGGFYLFSYNAPLQRAPIQNVKASENSKVASSQSKAEHSLWITDFEKARKLAKEQNKLILVDFSGSDWCGWCVRLEKEVFHQKEFKNYAKKNFILLLLDFPSQKPQSAALKKQNAKLAKEYKIEGYPTILILSADGKELARTGYQAGGPKAYIQHLNKLLKK